MKTLKKILICICVFALTLCLFAIPAFASSQFYPLPDIQDDPNAYPTVLPDNNQTRFAWPFNYGLIPLDGNSEYSTVHNGMSIYIEAEYYVRVVMTAWYNGEIFNDFAFTPFVDNIEYPSIYYSDSIDPISGVRTFEIDLERLGKEYQEIKLDLVINTTTTTIPDFISIGATPDDYEINRTVDFIMLSAGYYLNSSQAFYSVGETDGYINGLNSIDDISDNVLGIVSSPFQAIGTALNFELFGINLAKTFFFLLAVIVVAFIIRSVKND